MGTAPMGIWGFAQEADDNADEIRPVIVLNFTVLYM